MADLIAELIISGPNLTLPCHRSPWTNNPYDLRYLTLAVGRSIAHVLACLDKHDNRTNVAYKANPKRGGDSPVHRDRNRNHRSAD